MELPCIMLTFPTKIFCRGVSGFVSGCLFGFGVSGLTTSPLYVGPIFLQTYFKLDMSTARRRLKSSRSLSGTSAYPTMVILVNIMVMNEWLTSFSFHVNLPSHPWDKAISDSDLVTPRSRSWVWSKGKVIQSAQYPINSLPFHFTSIRPIILEIQLFRNSTLKHPWSRSWVRSKVKVTYYTQYPINALLFHFTSIGRTIPEIPHTPLQLCIHDQIHWILYTCAPCPSWQSCRLIFAQQNFHYATTLCSHYIQSSALESCPCLVCCIYTYMAPNTPTILLYSIFYTHIHVVYGRGWSHWLTIPCLFGWYTSQTMPHYHFIPCMRFNNILLFLMTKVLF